MLISEMSLGDGSLVPVPWGHDKATLLLGTFRGPPSQEFDIERTVLHVRSKGHMRLSGPNLAPLIWQI